MAIKYGDLPARDRTSRTVPAKGRRAGYTVEGRPVVLRCGRCLSEFSATRGDYFMRDPNAVITHCGRPMTLIRWDPCTAHEVTPAELAELAAKS